MNTLVLCHLFKVFCWRFVCLFVCFSEYVKCAKLPFYVMQSGKKLKALIQNFHTNNSMLWYIIIPKFISVLNFFLIWYQFFSIFWLQQANFPVDKNIKASEYFKNFPLYGKISPYLITSQKDLNVYWKELESKFDLQVLI